MLESLAVVRQSPRSFSNDDNLLLAILICEQLLVGLGLAVLAVFQCYANATMIVVLVLTTYQCSKILHRAWDATYV